MRSIGDQRDPLGAGQRGLARTAGAGVILKSVSSVEGPPVARGLTPGHVATAPSEPVAMMVNRIVPSTPGRS